MLQLPTVILHHQTFAGSHYDWLWLDPATRDRLLGYRVPCAPNQWLARKSFLLEPLAPHRLAYLTYQGLITGERGRVIRVAKGIVRGNRIGDVGWDWQVHVHAPKATADALRVRIMPTNCQHCRGIVLCT
jgi:hypothetical protein